LVHPDDREKKIAYARMVLDGLQSTYRMEQRYVRHGDHVWVQLWCSLVRDSDGEPLYFIKTAEDITHRRALTAELVHKATHDPLTGLPNRGLLSDRLSQALARISRGGEVVALAIDLDGFKSVNDTYGHAAGDEVLVEVANRLHASVRASDTVCRLGGDEFLVICEDLSGGGVARDLAQRIVAAARQPVRLRQGGAVAVGASIGVAVSSRADEAPERLLQAADEALYTAKRKGRGRVELTEITLPAGQPLEA
jgi:diguanylate cyclase (GGDEF)-like protein